MVKWLFIFLIFFSASSGFSQLPRPLPDDPHQGGPPPEQPSPRPPDELPPPTEQIPYSLGTGETGRFMAKSNQFFLRYDLNRLTQIRLVGLENDIDIKEVVILYADYTGEEKEHTLPGTLKEGWSRVAQLSGRPIHSIEIVANSAKFWKKKGHYRVDVIAVK